MCKIMKPTNLFLTLVLLMQSSLALASWEPYISGGAFCILSCFVIYQQGRAAGKKNGDRAQYEKGKKAGYNRAYVKGWESGYRYGKEAKLHNALKHQQNTPPISELPVAKITSHPYNTRSKKKKH